MDGKLTPLTRTLRPSEIIDIARLQKLLESADTLNLSVMSPADALGHSLTARKLGGR